MNNTNQSVDLMRRTLWALAFFFSVIMPAKAYEEWFADSFAGKTTTADASVTVAVTDYTSGGCSIFGCTGPGRSPANTTIEKGDYGSSVMFGGRIGRWLENHKYSGLALEISSFKAEAQTPEVTIPSVATVYSYADIKKVDISAMHTTLVYMLRMPLLSSQEFPEGRLQPYLGIGLLDYANFNVGVDLRPTVANVVSASNTNFTYLSSHPQRGLKDYRVGFLWLVQRKIGIFAEYKITRARYELNKDDSGSTQTEMTYFYSKLESRHFYTGISYRF